MKSYTTISYSMRNSNKKLNPSDRIIYLYLLYIAYFMSTTIKKKMRRPVQRKKKTQTKVVEVIRLNKELTLRNVIQTQEQADFFMKMLKALQEEQD